MSQLSPLLGAMGGGMPDQAGSTITNGISYGSNNGTQANMPTCPCCGQAMPLPDNKMGMAPQGAMPPGMMGQGGANGMGGGPPEGMEGLPPELLMALLQGGMGGGGMGGMAPPRMPMG